MFTPGSPFTETDKRALIMTGPGQGEQGSDTNKLVVWGPHSLIKNSLWDGSVTLPGGNKRYPIVITFITDEPECYAEVVLQLKKYILANYPIRPKAVHLGGLSQSAFSLSTMITYESSPGQEDGMKDVTSLTCLSGFSTTNLIFNSPFAPADTLGTRAFGHWAKKYGGRYFGLEGTTDGVMGIWVPAQKINDSVPGAGYFSYETLGPPTGGHCCWNAMYSPTATNWTSTGTLGPNNATGAQPNTMGTYTNGQNIFTWMIMQGDTLAAGFQPNTLLVPRGVKIIAN